METIGNTALMVAIRLLEGMFAVGVVGSLLVLVLTTIDDAKVLFSSDEKQLRPDLDHPVNAFSTKQTVVDAR